MGQLIYYQVFCEDCCSIRIHGVWQKLTDDISLKLQRTMGQWDSLYTQCELCRQLEEAGLGHA